MKKFYKQLFLLVASLPLAISLFSQDLHFSQFFEAPLYRNPALAGIVKGDVRVQTVYRSQWNSIANAYKTTSLNAEYKFLVTGDDFLTLGVQVFNDKAGTTNLTTNHFLPAVNYHKSLSTEKNTYLSLGFMGGFVQRSVDRSKITTNSTYDRMGDGETTLLQARHTYMDGSAGISLSTQMGDNPENNLVLGAAYHHFSRPKASFYQDENVSVKSKMVFSADAKFALTDQFVASMYNDFVKQHNNREVISGLLLGYKVGPYTDDPDVILRAGAFYRWGDALIPVVQMDYRPFTVSVSYDVNLSRLSTSSYGRGGYELSLTYAGFLDRENSSANAVRCPQF